MKCCYVSPYEFVSRCKNGLYTLKDKYSHVLKKPISESHLVRFYGSKIYKVDQSTQLTPEKFESIPDTSCANQEYDMSFDYDDSCKCTNVYQSTPKESVPITSMPIKLQIVIMSSKGTAFSLDESETLSVGTQQMNCPLGNVNIDDIEIEIVEDLNDKDLPIHFWPLREVECIVSAMKLVS